MNQKIETLLDKVILGDSLYGFGEWLNKIKGPIAIGDTCSQTLIFTLIDRYLEEKRHA